eukprot:g4458.t1
MSARPFLSTICDNIDSVNLVALDLSYCGLGDGVGTLVGALLEKSKTLTSMDISHNRLYENSASAIATGLKENRAITALYVGFNKLTEAGTIEIVKAIAKHRSIKHLGIENTAITSPQGGDDQVQRVFEKSMKVVDEFIDEFLAPLDRRALQLSVLKHKNEHTRIFWFGVMTGWIKSKEFPYDKYASSYYLDILTHLFDKESIGDRLKSFGNNTMKNHAALELFEAGVDRMSGDVIPEEHLVDSTFTKLTEASFLSELSQIENKVVKIDDGLDILIRFWYVAVRSQM